VKPLCIDLFCGLGGWAEGFLSEGWDVIGFDNKKHDYGTGTYPGQLVLQDVLTLHGAQFYRARAIVASPPCQEPSYRFMPWSRSKNLPPPINFITLFWTCYRIQYEAEQAAGREIPLLIENVVGAQRWIGRADWHFGSYYLWGNVPALMPKPLRALKGSGIPSWGDFAKTGKTSPHWMEAVKQHGSGAEWFDKGICSLSSNSFSRKAASAHIAKIPPLLAQYIAQVFKP
jgi:hypothetical protein